MNVRVDCISFMHARDCLSLSLSLPLPLRLNVRYVGYFGIHARVCFDSRQYWYTARNKGNIAITCTNAHRHTLIKIIPYHCTHACADECAQRDTHTCKNVYLHPSLVEVSYPWGGLPAYQKLEMNLAQRYGLVHGMHFLSWWHTYGARKLQWERHACFDSDSLPLRCLVSAIPPRQPERLYCLQHLCVFSSSQERFLTRDAF
jgi:hypothetical protein